MLFSVALLSVASLAVFTAATPAGLLTADMCSTGSVQCCDTLQRANSHGASKLLRPLGLVIEGLTGQIGGNCIPITGIGVGGASCGNQVACCSNVHSQGLVAVGCTPIFVGL